jgi:hypothetical protein
MELFEWASSGHERTLNQRIRPALVVIVNKFTDKSDAEWLDENYATKTLLAHFQLSDAFADQREKWVKRGKTVNTAEDLILCYYDSFRVICVPNLTNFKSASLIMKQYQTLYREIRSSSVRLREKRKQYGMNLDSESFNTYVEHAFHRLAKDLKSPIDFYYLASKDSSIPRSFNEHLTVVVTKMLKASEYDSSDQIGQERDLLNRLTPYIATCIASQLPSRSTPQRKPPKIQYESI